MIRHVAQMGAAMMLIVVCMLLPFLPGRYDRLATTLSAMSQLWGFAGVLLVPLGAIWLWHELRRSRKSAATGKTGHWLGLASITASTLVAAAFALVASIEVGLSLAAGVIALWACWAVRLVGRLRALRGKEVRRFNPAPLYLVVLPLVAATSRALLIDPASEFSRDRAIENSAALIGDIERYHDANGEYPPSLLSVWKDYHPSVVGIEKYHYESRGGAYNLYFENTTGRLGTREFVVYNPRDQQVMTSHAMDLLQLTPEQLEVEWTRGHNAVHDAAHPHWKYFWFD